MLEKYREAQLGGEFGIKSLKVFVRLEFIMVSDQRSVKEVGCQKDEPGSTEEEQGPEGNLPVTVGRAGLTWQNRGGGGGGHSAALS